MEFPTSNANVHKLANGLTVILDPDPSASVISTQLWVESGSIHEGEFLGSGISHLLEHMVFKGTKSFDSEGLSRAVQGAGGQWNAYTTFDRTVYYIDGPAEGASTFIKVLLEMVFHPTFPPNEFEKEKDVIRREIDMGLDDPDSRSSRQLFSTAFLDDDRRYPVIGHLELFNLITRQDMIEYHRGRYTTENCFICLSGGFIESDILLNLESLSKDISRKFVLPAAPRYEPEQQGMRKDIGYFSVPVSKHTFAWQGPNLEHEDAAALDLACYILGGGRSSRLYQNLREDKELCLHVGAWSYLPAKCPGLIAVSAELEAEQIEDFEKALQQEIMRVLSDPLDQELSKAKRMTLSSQLKTLTTASGKASDLASNWHEARNLNFTSEYLKKIDAVSISDIRRVVEYWMIAEHRISKVTLHPLDKKNKIEKLDSRDLREREIIEKQLSNGIRVNLCRDARVPLVAMNVAVKTGLPSESASCAGLNSLLASLLLKGTTTRSAAEIAANIDALGATMSFGSGNNTTIGSASCLMPDTEKVMELFADCIKNPALSQDAIDREKAIQINDVQERDLDPASLAFKELRQAMFGENGYGIPSSGTEESVSGLDRMALYAQHKAYFNAPNMVVSIFGDVEPEHMVALAEKYFGSIPSGKVAQFAPQEVLSSSLKQVHLDKQQAVLALGFHGVGIAHLDRYALGLINAWCSDMAGPLFTKIREELGLAYFVSSSMFHGFDCGLFTFYMGTSPEQIEQAKRELLGAIAEIAERGMDQETLDRVKKSWIAKQALANQSNASMASLCSVDSLLGLGASHFKETQKVIDKLTVDDIASVAKKYFGKQEATIVIVKPEGVK